MKKSLALIIGAFLAFTACEEQDIRKGGLLVPKTADEDSSVPSINVNGTVLHSETFGNPKDPMIVVLHGGPGSDYRYVLNCKAFASNGFYVVFYDQRGCGLSKRESKSSLSMQQALDDLAAVVAYYRSSPQQKIIFLGQSWGAMLATAYINQNPNAVVGAILGEPGGFLWKDIKDYVKRSQSYSLVSEALNDATYLDQFITGKESQQEILDYKWGVMSGTQKSKDNPLGIEADIPFWRLGAVIHDAMFEYGEKEKPDWTTNLKSFDRKVLFLYSEKNRAYGQGYAEHVSSAYPKVQLERVNGAGHDMITLPAGWNNYFPIALNYLNELK